MADQFVVSPNTPIAPVGASARSYTGGPGTYDGDDCAPFSEYARTSTPNGPPEKVYDGSVPNIPIPIPSTTPTGLPSKG